MQKHTFSTRLGNGSSLGQHQLRFIIRRWSTLSDKEISFAAWRCHPKLQQLRNDWCHRRASDVQQGCPCPPVPCPPPLKARARLESPAGGPCLSLLYFVAPVETAPTLPPSWGDPGSSWQHSDILGIASTPPTSKRKGAGAGWKLCEQARTFPICPLCLQVLWRQGWGCLVGLVQAFSTFLDAIDHNRAEKEHLKKRNNTAMTAASVISPQDNEDLDFSPITTFCTLADEPMKINTCKKYIQGLSRAGLLNLQWNNLIFLYPGFWSENLHLDYIIWTSLSNRFYAITSISLSVLFSCVAVFIRKSWNKKLLFSVNKKFRFYRKIDCVLPKKPNLQWPTNKIFKNPPSSVRI